MDPLLEEGIKKIEWARCHMGVMKEIRKHLLASGTLKGVRIAMALHTEAKTGVLAIMLKEAGAKVALTSCNPLSTDDSVALALNKKYGVTNYAKKGQTTQEYYKAMNKVLDIKPQILIDDGADLVSIVLTKRKELIKGIIGSNEETTTGVVRLRQMEKEGVLKFPVVNVNGAFMKHLFDNRYGTGQSTIDGILTATNITIAGKTFVIAGYSWCGVGIALRAKGLGARVIITELDPIKAIEAHFDGFQVLPMDEAAKLADIIVTATGDIDVVVGRHMDTLKDGCMLANSGHFDVEINKDDLRKRAKTVRNLRYGVDEYLMKDGRRIYLLGDGRLVNLAVGQGHPVEIMDLSFAMQMLGVEYLLNNRKVLKNKVYDIPYDVDTRVAEIKLRCLGTTIDIPTPEQLKYMCSWRTGT